MRTTNYLGGNSDGLDDDVPGECFLQDIHCQACDGPWSIGALTNKKKNLCKKISNCPYFLTAAKAVLLSTLQHNTVLESSAPSVAKNCLRVHNSRMLMWLCFHNSGTVSENIEFFQYHPYPVSSISINRFHIHSLCWNWQERFIWQLSPNLQLLHRVSLTCYSPPYSYKLMRTGTAQL